MSSAGGGLSKPWDWRPTDCGAEQQPITVHELAVRAPGVLGLPDTSVRVRVDRRSRAIGSRRRPEGSFSKNGSSISVQ